MWFWGTYLLPWFCTVEQEHVLTYYLFLPIFGIRCRAGAVEGTYLLRCFGSPFCNLYLLTTCRLTPSYLLHKKLGSSVMCSCWRLSNMPACLDIMADKHASVMCSCWRVSNTPACLDITAVNTPAVCKHASGLQTQIQTRLHTSRPAFY